MKKIIVILLATLETISSVVLRNWDWRQKRFSNVLSIQSMDVSHRMNAKTKFINKSNKLQLNIISSIDSFVNINLFTKFCFFSDDLVFCCVLQFMWHASSNSTCTPVLNGSQEFLISKFFYRLLYDFIMNHIAQLFNASQCLQAIRDTAPDSRLCKSVEGSLWYISASFINIIHFI